MTKPVILSPEQARSASRGTPAFVFVCALLLSALRATTLHAQTIQIRLLDGKTGRPVAHACVGVSMKNDHPAKGTIYESVDIPTDTSGTAQLRLTEKDEEAKVSYDPKLGCGGHSAINPVLKYDITLAAYSSLYNPTCAFPESIPNARYHEIAFSTKDVIEHGLMSANTCGKVIVSPQPGEVILFVRPRNHQEKKQDCLAGELPIFCW